MTPSLSAAAKDQLRVTFAKSVLAFKGGWTIDDVLREIEAAVAVPAFSEQIIEGAEVRRRCSLGEWHSVYRLSWRSCYVRVLEIVRANGPMTTAQIGNLFTGELAATVRKAPSELTHFGLLIAVGRAKGGDKQYDITGEGRYFLDGLQQAYEWVWPEGAPRECEPGPLRYRHEMETLHPGNDRNAHVQSSAGADNSGLSCHHSVSFTVDK